ncbi:alpha/beta fold hydrolase [Qipengyuania sp. DGS5-3]|uniref:alpha/beta fold hydrolase n=1 Tax=Qipengyuania sp. DGS5-3 TaxID=3349632 RepID=UPI0036D2A997
MELHQTRITLANGIELDVVDEGPRDAPALIFLHGFPENHRTWRHQIAHLSDRYRCIAPDQRGYRGSSRPEGVEAYDASELIGDIFHLAAALGLKEFTIVGHDWGGAIAWGVALRGQEMGMVVRAIIANAPHPLIFQKLLYTNHNQREASQYIRDFRDTANDALVREQGLGALLERVTNWQNDDAMEPAERDLLRQDWSNGEAAIAMLNWYRASAIDVPDMEAPFALPEGWEAPTLPNLTIPTLVIWALDDTALPAENLDGLDTVVENMTLVEVPNCGHFVPWEAPDAVNAAMDAFLKP